jgi:hypothetical protein
MFGIGSFQGFRVSLHARRVVLRGTFLTIGGAMSVSILLSGCFHFPVKAAPVTEGSGGKKTVADPSTIRPGTSTREEILRDWNWCDTHVDSAHLFVGSVRRSASRSVQMIGEIPVDFSRNWKIEYLFAEFDDKGVVSRTYFIPSGHLARAILAWIRSAPQPYLDVSHPIELKSVAELSKSWNKWADQRSYEIVILLPDSIELIHKEAKDTVVRIPSDQLRKFEEGTYVAEQGGEGWTGFSLGLAGTQRPGNKVNLHLNVSNLVTFLRYLNQVAPSALPKSSK